MYLPRSLAGFLPSSGPRKWDILCSTYALRPFPFLADRAVRAYGKSPKAPAIVLESLPVETQTAKIPPELPRPSLIPFQVKVANSVHLVGTITTGVKLHQHSDGSCASVSILVDGSMDESEASSKFMIPIIFRGDLAEVAACHLKKDDIVYVSGQLSGDNLPSDQKDTKENIKLIAQSLNFVKEASSRKRGQFIHKDDEVSTSDSGNMKRSGNELKRLWDELFIEPKQWLDNREGKLKGLLNIRGPDFVHKESRNGLWLNSAPDWILPKLEDLVFGGSDNITKQKKENITKAICKDDLWKKLVENPEQWWDNRSTKPKATYPDFKHKGDGDVLWLSSAPMWVLSKLPPLPAEKNAASK